MEKKKIFIICSEKSGDSIIDDVLCRLQHADIDIGNIEFCGIVGDDLVQKFNVKQIFRRDVLSTIGIGDVISRIPVILDKISTTAIVISNFQPDLVISVDGYDFCIRVAKKVRKNMQNTNNIKLGNVKFWHIVAPSVWAYWPWRAKVLARYYNQLFYFLSFEKNFFKPLEKLGSDGFTSTFVGYPATFQKRDNKVIKDPYLIGIMIGSRRNEIKRHKNLVIDVIMRLKILCQQYRFVVFATKETSKLIQRLFGKVKNIAIVDDTETKKEIIKKCQLVIAKSGTNNIEIGALGTAMITYYKTSWLTYRLIRTFTKVKLINLFNIVLGHMAIPEFIQKKANPENLVEAAYELLMNGDVRQEQLRQIDTAIKLMQREDKMHPCDIIANKVVEFLNLKK